MTSVDQKLKDGIQYLETRRLEDFLIACLADTKPQNRSKGLLRLLKNYLAGRVDISKVNSLFKESLRDDATFAASMISNLVMGTIAHIAGMSPPETAWHILLNLRNFSGQTPGRQLELLNRTMQEGRY